MRVCLMIEGQEGVTWEEWLALAEECERSPIEAMFRSDHYLSVVGRHERGSLDAWATINALSGVTSELRLGTLVSPATFRHPSVLAKSAVTADHISGGGRIEVGMGAGWLEAEHAAYGFPFPDTGVRLQMLEEQVEIVHREWRESDLTFEGEHYRLRGLDACESAGRDRLTISLMTGSLIGADEADLADRARRLAELRRDDAGDVAAYIAGLPDSWIVGTLEAVREQLAALEEAGVERVMFQHLLHRDLDGVALIGELAAS
jgi:alkanesulfonate monooxygenase SsuD/methylene tetrahydromethanopterin reductase-like flavin-dependent oxidoreductase (luciferase family)